MAEITYSDRAMTSSKYSQVMEHTKWLKEIPYLKFPSEWEVQISPPFTGAVVRFRVKYNDREVSVYLDCYGSLGAIDQPYWEIYPHQEDTYRCYMNETEELMNAIKESLEA